MVGLVLMWSKGGARLGLVFGMEESMAGIDVEYREENGWVFVCGMEGAWLGLVRGMVGFYVE
jgi:hypothetical protein